MNILLRKYVLLFFIFSLFFSSCQSLQNHFGALNSDPSKRFGKIVNVTREDGLIFYNLAKYEYAPNSIYGSSKSLSSLILNPNDRIKIIHNNYSDTSERIFIRENGTFDYKNLKNISVYNKTIYELEKELGSSLSLIYPGSSVKIVKDSEDYLSFVDDDLSQFAPVEDGYMDKNIGDYFIKGMVSNPGKFKIVENETILSAIKRAGGILHRNADLTRSIFIRDDKLLPINFNKLIRRKDKSLDINLQDQDIIIISNSFKSRIEVIGEVNNPGSFPLRSINNLEKAIMASSGFTKFADIGNAILIRGGIVNTKIAELNFDSSSEEKNNLYIARLKSGDILFIPEKNKKYPNFRKLLNKIFISVTENSFKNIMMAPITNSEEGTQNILDQELLETPENLNNKQNSRMPDPIF